MCLKLLENTQSKAEFGCSAQGHPLCAWKPYRFGSLCLPHPSVPASADACWVLSCLFFPHYSMCRESIPVWEEDSSKRPWFGIGFVALWLCGNSLILCLSTNLEKKEQSVKVGAFGHNAGIKSYFLHRTPASAELETPPPPPKLCIVITFIIIVSRVSYWVYLMVLLKAAFHTLKLVIQFSWHPNLLQWSTRRLQVIFSLILVWECELEVHKDKWSWLTLYLKPNCCKRFFFFC